MTTLLHVFSTFGIGGPQKRFAQIASASGDRFRHVVIAADGQFDACDLLAPGSSVEFVPPPSRDGHLLTRAARFRARVKDVSPSVIVTYNWGAIEWAPASWALPVTHIHVEDGFGPDEAQRQLGRRVWFRRLALAKSYAIVVPSKTLQTIARDTWRLSAHRVCYIPNGIEASAYQATGEAGAEMRVELDLPSAAPVIGWVGGIRREKNVGRLVRAFAKTSPDATLVIVGDGPERGIVESEIQTLGIASRVRLIGMRADVQRLMPAFDILALSSDTEQMPMVVLEAMAAGLPVAAVDVGDVRGMVSPENLRFVVERSDAALAGALSGLLASPELRRSIGSANRAHVAQHFPIDRMVASYLALFENAARRRTRPARGL